MTWCIVGWGQEAICYLHATNNFPESTGRICPAVPVDPPPGTEFALDAELVLIAMGFLGRVRTSRVEELGLSIDARGNLATDEHNTTSVPGVFGAGDMRRGQSLVVRAIAERTKAAAAQDAYLRRWRRC